LTANNEVAGERMPAPHLDRRPVVKADQLEAGIVAMGGALHDQAIKDVVDNVGGSPMTVTVAIDRLEAQEKISAAGERSNLRGSAEAVEGRVALPAPVPGFVMDGSRTLRSWRSTTSSSQRKP